LTLLRLIRLLLSKPVRNVKTTPKMKEKGCGSDRCIADQACAIDYNTTTDTHYSAGSSSGCGGLLDARLESAAEQGWQHKQRAALPSHTRPVADCACDFAHNFVVSRVSRKRSRLTVSDRDYFVTATNNAAYKVDSRTSTSSTISRLFGRDSRKDQDGSGESLRSGIWRIFVVEWTGGEIRCASALWRNCIFAVRTCCAESAALRRNPLSSILPTRGGRRVENHEENEQSKGCMCQTIV